MRAGVRPAACLLALLLLAGACSSPAGDPVPTEPPVPSSPEAASPATKGPGSAAAALEALCNRPPAPGGERVRAEGPPTAPIAGVQRQVEEVRGLGFRHRVAVEAATRDELVRRLRSAFRHSYPEALYRRRSRAWAAIGVIAPKASIRQELQEFVSSQVIGFYVPSSGELVFMGTDDPSPLQRVTLAHEFTHALEDQHFDLRRLDALEAGCRDEELMAALGVVEGSAQYFAVQMAVRFLSLEEQLGLADVDVPSLSGIEPFVVQLQAWPYGAGLAFVTRLVTEGGTEAVDEALRDLPPSTEQILHPERYPNDVPQPVDVLDLADALGKGWKDLDVMVVGEAWLAIMLGLRLEEDQAEVAAAGWDGGVYRAWSHGNRVAVVLQTVWDTETDAAEFADAVGSWIRGGQPASLGGVQGTQVTVLFASDRGTLRALQEAT